MVKRIQFTGHKQNGRIILSFHDGLRRHQVAHALPAQPQEDA